MQETSAAKLSIRQQQLPEHPNARVLDVGCGDGRHAAASARRGNHTVAVDYDGATVLGARARLAHSGIDFLVADAARLPFRDAAFDAVICTETLEHLPDDAAAIAEIARVLAPEGALHGAVPTHFTERLYWLLSPGYRTAPGGHVRIYTPRALLAQLRRNGLRVSGARFAHSIDSLIWLRFCLEDRLRGRRPRTAFEQAVALAVAAERRTPAWRHRLRSAVARSRFLAAFDAAGALIWPKSFVFVATKPPASSRPREGAREFVRTAR
ncbi:MAG: class I SAM-dependent methyltransferase [Dehalococcoidia bacterium]